MDQHSFTVIIQGEQAGQYRDACQAFATIPTIAPIRVRVVSDQAALLTRQDLVAALVSDLSASVGGGPDLCIGPGALGCWATSELAARNLLVVVASNAAPSVALEDLVDEWIARGFDALAVFRRGLNPDQVLPSALRRQHAPSWVHDVREVAGELLDTVLMGDEARRVFISYSHNDGAAEAERLAQLLNELRFDVFLDRFRLEPGVDFVERIADELVDKAMVVVIETPEAVSSAWVQHEVSTASAQHLGLAAIHVNGPDKLPLIEDRARHDWTSDGDVRDFVLHQHRSQLRAKRENLLDSVWQALLAAKVPAADISARAHGFRVELKQVAYDLAVQARPADLRRFRLAAERAGTAAQAVVVHPLPVRVDRRQDLTWLTNETPVAQVDEGLLTQAAALIAKGGQP